MNDVLYDLPIKEVAEMLDKSDRQVRRYVKEKKLKARAVRVDGHVRLMFNTEQVLAFKERFNEEGILTEAEPQPEQEDVILDARIVEGSDDGQEPVLDEVIDVTDAGDGAAVKYVIDALREQIKDLREENRELHHELEQRSGLVGFWQGKAEQLQEEMKMLMPAQKPEDAKKPWYKRLFGGA